MANQRFSIRGAHLLMWSSPLLLLVLVFTLRGSNTTPEVHHLANVVHDNTTTTLASTTTTSRATSPTSTTATVAMPTTTHPPSRSSGVATSSTAKVTASEPSANVTSGVLEGQLSLALGVVDIPLQGPGIWTLSTTAPSVNQVDCPTSTRSVSTYIAVVNSQHCQLQISPATTGASLTWLLTPVP
jgi:hypothetical protein